VDQTGCPTPRGYGLDLASHERQPRSCGRLACPHCGPRRALSTANAIAMSSPCWSGVLTVWGGTTPEETADLFRLFARSVAEVVSSLRSGGRVLEYCWVLELSSSRIANAHILMWGDPVQRGQFRAAAAAAGMRWGDVQPIRNVAVMARYVLKLPLAPLDRGLDGKACMRLHLDLNGQRLVHSSMRFWRDGDGRCLTGVRAARSEARRRSRGRSKPSRAEIDVWRRGWDLPEAVL
jgi:hypothetical protein